MPATLVSKLSTASQVSPKSASFRSAPTEPVDPVGFQTALKEARGKSKPVEERVESSDKPVTVEKKTSGDKKTKKSEEECADCAAGAAPVEGEVETVETDAETQATAETDSAEVGVVGMDEDGVIDPGLMNVVAKEIEPVGQEGEVVEKSDQAQVIEKPVARTAGIVMDEEDGVEMDVVGGEETGEVIDREAAAIDLEEFADDLIEDETIAPAADQVKVEKGKVDPSKKSEMVVNGAQVNAESAQSESTNQEGSNDQNGAREPELLKGLSDAPPRVKGEEFAGELKTATGKSAEAPVVNSAGEGQKTMPVIERQPMQMAHPSPVRAFAVENHDAIISGVRTQLLPNGGQMQIKLSPGDLGQMQITVKVVDGVLSATFMTSSDDATRLLSHSLTQLKSALEGQGVSIDRIQVTQGPREAQPSQNQDGRQNQQDNPNRQQQQETMHHEHQRRQLLERMWRRMAGGGDPLDLVA